MVSVFKSRRVVLPEGVTAKALVVEQGLIRALDDYDAYPGDGPFPTERTSHTRKPSSGATSARIDRVVDFGDRVLMPGLVDCHVHINEPGRTEWEGFETATHAAAAGGITTLVDMPLNCIPVTTSAEALGEKLAVLGDKLMVDCGFWGGVVPGNVGRLPALFASGVRGAKCFLIHSGIDDFPNVTEGDLRRAMPIIAKTGLPLLVHAEFDSDPLGHQHVFSDKRAYSEFLASRPEKWELDAIELMIRLCRETGCRVHIVHLSCAGALPMIRAAKAEGLPLTAETCSHYLTIHAEDVPAGNTRFKCAPPIRERENCERLWDALADGTLDFIVSDHSPCTPELKKLEEGDFEGAWGGISSVQFGLPVIWTEARKRGFSVDDLVRWMARGTADFAGFGAEKGRLAPGYEADFCVWDPEVSTVLTKENIRYKNKMSAYEGRTLLGKVEETWLRGEAVFKDGKLDGPAKGRPRLLERT